MSSYTDSYYPRIHPNILHGRALRFGRAFIFQLPLSPCRIRA